MDIFVTPWLATPQGPASLASLLESPDDYTDLNEPPLVKQAVLRLLLAMASVSSQHQPLPGDMLLWGDDGRPGFLQVTGLPPASARTPQAIVAMQDGSGPALTPANLLITQPPQADLVRALLASYFCDRPGLKAQVRGLSISGAKPSHMGNLIAWRWGRTLGDFLDLNAVPLSDWVPWWKRPIDYSEALHPDSPDLVQYLLWPWRRLQVFPHGVTIAAGLKCTLADPWVIGRASLRHLRGLDDAIRPAGPARVAGLALNQASPVAWLEWSISG